MPDNYGCDHELCRDPFNKDAYVINKEGSIFCLFCYLVHELGMDASDADDLTYKGKNA